MIKYFFVIIFLFSTFAEAVPFQKLPWRIPPRAVTYIAVMDGAAASSNEYLNDGNLGRSNIYGATAADTNIKVPSIHAYNPGTYRFAAIELDPAIRPKLPANLPIPAAEITRYFLSIEKLDTEPLRFRPHRFVDRNTPTIAANGAYNYAPNIQAGVFNLDGTRVPFADFPGQGLVNLDARSFSVHSGAGDQILSSNSMHMTPVAGEPTRAYYSIVAHNDGKSRVAVTLHWLINEFDSPDMWALLENSGTTELFSQSISNSAFVGSPAANEVLKIMPAPELAFPVNAAVADLNRPGPFETNLRFWKALDGLDYNHITRTEFGGFKVTYMSNARAQNLTYEIVNAPEDRLMRVSFQVRSENLNSIFTLRENGEPKIFLDDSFIKIIPGDNKIHQIDVEFFQEAGKNYLLCWGKDETPMIGALHLENFTATPLY